MVERVAVFIKAKTGRIIEVLCVLQRMECVIDAKTVHGDWDIAAVISAEKRFEVQSLPGIEKYQFN